MTMSPDPNRTKRTFQLVCTPQMTTFLTDDEEEHRLGKSRLIFKSHVQGSPQEAKVMLCELLVIDVQVRPENSSVLEVVFSE